MSDDALIEAHDVKYDIMIKKNVFPIIENVSLTIRLGETLGILGPNGCGKSTLLRLLVGLDQPSAGKINYTSKSCRLGMIFQEVKQNLVPWRTVLDNIALPLIIARGDKEKALAKLKVVLARMDLEALSGRYPHELSGGQQQLVNLARWLANPPSVLFVDEGWSMLDLVQRQRAYEVLGNLARDSQCAVCVVSHNIPELAGVADRVLVMDKRPMRVAVEVDLHHDSSPITRSKRLWEAAKSVFNSSSMV